MKILFTCGGTAGHIYPAVAVAHLIKSRHKDAEILFVGAENGMETRLVPAEGYPIKTVTVKNLRHSLHPKAFLYNAKVVMGLVAARAQAAKILQSFDPDMVIGTGGYASYPVASVAARMGIPTAVHESNAMPGWTTRMLSSKADAMLISFADSQQYYPKSKQVLMVGTPVRPDFINGSDRADARKALGITDDLPLVVSFWGSLGARDMNRMMLDFMAMHKGGFHHIHASGKFAFEEMQTKVAPHPLLDLREFIFDMPLVMRAADVVLCRAGASTLAELCAAGKPAILVPSPNVTNNHQEANARVLERSAAALCLRETECSGQRLYHEVTTLLADTERRRAMSLAASKLGVLDASERIYQVIQSHMLKR